MKRKNWAHNLLHVEGGWRAERVIYIAETTSIKEWADVGVMPEVVYILEDGFRSGAFHITPFSNEDQIPFAETFVGAIQIIDRYGRFKWNL